MSITNADGIVTPDEGTVNDPVVYLAAMADSISGGIGERRQARERSCYGSRHLHGGERSSGGRLRVGRITAITLAAN